MSKTIQKTYFYSLMLSALALFIFDQWAHGSDHLDAVRIVSGAPGNSSGLTNDAFSSNGKLNSDSGDRALRSEQISWSCAPGEINQDGRYTLKIDYSVSETRDLAILLLNPEDWSYYGGQAQTVSAGSGTVTFTVDIKDDPLLQVPHYWKGELRPHGGTWRDSMMNIWSDVQVVSNVVVDACDDSTPAACKDGIQNQDETDIDCGGSTCAACPIGKTCDAHSDCQSGFCDDGVCATSDPSPPDDIPEDAVYVDGLLSTSCNGTYSISNRDCSGNDGVAYPAVNQAMDSAREEATVVIRGGTYVEALNVNHGGSENAYLTIRSYPGETAILDGKGNLPTYWGGMINIYDQAYVRIHGLTITNSKFMGLYADRSDHIKISNCTISHTTDGGAVVEDGKDVLVDGCTVHDTNQRGGSAAHEGISMHGVDGFEIKNCTVYDCKEEGIDAKARSTNGSIHHCVLWDNASTNIYIDQANNIDIHSNTIYNTTATKFGIFLGIEHWGGPPYDTHHINVYNNIVHHTGGAVQFWIEDAVKDTAKYYDILIINNLFYANNRRNGEEIINWVSAQNFGENIEIRNNIFWKNNKGAVGGHTTSPFAFDHNLFDSNMKSIGSNAVSTADVMFVDEAAEEFHLRQGSPAKGKGSSQGAPDYDFDGSQRSTPQDIGPFVVP